MIVVGISANAAAVRALVGDAINQMVQNTASARKFTYCFLSELKIGTYHTCYNHIEMDMFKSNSIELLIKLYHMNN